MQDHIAQGRISAGIRGNLLIFIATVLFGVDIPVVKWLIPEWLSANDITVFRLIGGCILFWLLSAFIKTQRIERSDFPRILIGGGLGLFAFIFLFNMSLHYADPIDVSIIMTLPPVFVILINVIFRGVRPRAMEYVGVAVALAGAVWVILDSHGATDPDVAKNSFLGKMFAMASGLSYAIYLIVLERPTHIYRPVSLLRWVFLAASIPTLALLLRFPEANLFHACGPIVKPWLMIGFVVIGPTFLAYLMVNPAIKLIGSELVSLYQYLLPIIATICAVAMKLSVLHMSQVIAMALIIGGMILTNLASRKRKKTDQTHH